MEMKEVGERVAITKPVASKPSCSSFKSFSELLAGAIDVSPTLSSPPPASNALSSETAVPAPIRPKTVRVKPTLNHDPSPPPPTNTSTLPFSQMETSGTAACSSFDDKVSKVGNKPNNVLYKPLAKVVSKATVSLLANMGNSSAGHRQASVQVEPRAVSNQHKLHSTPQPITNRRPSIASPVEKSRPVEPPKTATPRIVEEDPQPYISTANVDRPSYDGYNWRKYGQKQVKGSEYPRSYYKCTHPNCPVKKKVERSFDGQIAEIVYKGEHNHAKPQPPKRNSPTLGLQGPSDSDGVGQDQDKSSSKNNGKSINNNKVSERYDDSERHELGGASNQSSYPFKSQRLSYDPAAVNMGVANAGGTPDNSWGHNHDCEEGSKGLDADDDEPRSKRRKNDNQNNEAGTSQDSIKEPRVLMQSTAEAEILEDGFRWRKYGQKVVKGNPYPRSYYRCTSLKCNVRKHVERVSDDPRSFITTYEGKHNHEMPAKITNSVASDQPDSQAPNKDGQ